MATPALWGATDEISGHTPKDMARYYNKMDIHDGATGALLDSLFEGFPIRSCTGFVIPQDVRGTYLLLQ